MENNYKIICLVLILTILISGVSSNSVIAYSVSETYKDFDEISSWALDSIEKASLKGFISGYNGKFNPKGLISRAEFTKILVEAFELDLETLDSKNIKFKDVKETDWYFDYINIASGLDIVSGYDNYFKPNDYINREEMASMIIRALENKNLSLDKSKEDFKYIDNDKISSWARDKVDHVSNLGIMKGSNQAFNPKGPVTREMATVSILRGYNLLEASDKLTSEDLDSNKKVSKRDLSPLIKGTGDKMVREINPANFGTIGGDWTVLALARGSMDLPDDYYDNYYNNIEEFLKLNNGKLSSVKYTEYSRLILSLTAIGRDVTDVSGYNLLEEIANFDNVKKQGINGPIFALLALDSNNYEVPKIKPLEKQTTREKLIDFILSREIEGGGWNLGVDTKEANVDITSMAIQSLAPYYNKRGDVKEAIDRAVEILSYMQDEKTGGYYSWNKLNSESSSQVVTALTSMSIDPLNDERFIKNGVSVLENLLSYRLKDGSFYHVKPEDSLRDESRLSELDFIATDQAMYAMVSYDRFIKGMNSLYDMTDVKDN